MDRDNEFFTGGLINSEQRVVILHETTDNGSAEHRVNADHIVSVKVSGDGTSVVFLSTGRIIVAVEPADDIMNVTG